MKPCNTCPFLKGTENLGALDWLKDIAEGVKRGSLSHSCHKTDPKADGYVGHKEGKDSVCVGFLGMIKKISLDCIDPKINKAMVEGRFDFADVPTEGCFESFSAFAQHHLAPHLKKEADHA